MRGQATQIIESRVLTVDANKMAEQMAREAQEMGFERRENLALDADAARIDLVAVPADIKSAVIQGDSSKGTPLETHSDELAASVSIGEGGLPS
jgi:hypothetical protein